MTRGYRRIGCLVGILGAGGLWFHVPVALAAGRTSLAEAAQRGDLPAVRLLLNQPGTPDDAGLDGTTALHWAAQRGNLEMTGVLLGKGAKPDTPNRYGITPLRLASIAGHLPIVEALLAAGANPNQVRPESGDTVLMVAARSGHAGIVRALLAKGAMVDVAEPLRKQTALMWAAAEGHAEVVRVLLEGGASIKALSSTKMSPLTFAIRSGKVDVVRTMLDAGAGVNEPASDGTRPLVLAILNAHFEVAAFLLERGADANVDDPHGKPLHVLTFMRRASNIALSTTIPRQLPLTGVDAFALANALLAKGADINARYAGMGPPKHVALGSYRVPFKGATPFYIASITADVPFMKFLASKGANPTLATTANITPLLAAAGVGFWEGETPGKPEEAFEAVKLAVELGNDPKAVVTPGPERLDPTWSGANAMHGAANRGASEMVRWLAARGVPLDLKSAKGVTPYHIAAGLDSGQFHAWPETAKVIVQVGAERGVTIDTTDPKFPRGGY